MREILFRGQTRRYGEKVRMGDGEKLPSHWVYGGVLQGIGAYSIIYGGENVNDPSEGLDKFTVYTDTLGQYTGLKDKNGKRIFEGDVVAYQAHKYKVIYYAPFAMWMLDDRSRQCGTNGMYTQFRECEVIGNIHDNPELLEEVKGDA